VKDKEIRDTLDAQPEPAFRQPLALPACSEGQERKPPAQHPPAAPRI